MIPTVETLTPETLNYLTEILGSENVTVNQTEREHHARDQSFHDAHLPAAVVYPETTAQVSAILKHANEHRIPVTPWGTGTSLEGNSIPLAGGIVLDLLRMNKILAVYPEDFQVDVQPGIPYKDMNAKLAAQGLFFWTRPRRQRQHRRHDSQQRIGHPHPGLWRNQR